MGHPRGPDAALAVVLLAVVAVGVLDGLCQGAIFGDAASQPSEYTHVRVCQQACLCKVPSKPAAAGYGLAECTRSMAAEQLDSPWPFPAERLQHAYKDHHLAYHVPHAQPCR